MMERTLCNLYIMRPKHVRTTRTNIYYTHDIPLQLFQISDSPGCQTIATKDSASFSTQGDHVRLDYTRYVYQFKILYILFTAPQSCQFIETPI